jgi:hypothetical protein
VVFDRAAKRAAVLMSDTDLTDMRGLATIGLHLIDPKVPVGAPRTVATADAKLIDAGSYSPHRHSWSEYHSTGFRHGHVDGQRLVRT